jgi:hypothetical protein
MIDYFRNLKEGGNGDTNHIKVLMGIGDIGL